MKDLGESKRILEINMHRDLVKKRLWLNQVKYVHCILEKFNIIGFKGVRIPLTTHFRLFESHYPIDVIEKGKMYVFFMMFG